MIDDVDDFADQYQPIPAVRHEPKINPAIPKTIQLVTRTETFISRFAAKRRALAGAPDAHQVETQTETCCLVGFGGVDERQRNSGDRQADGKADGGTDGANVSAEHFSC